jgi:hypothetical protein
MREQAAIANEEAGLSGVGIFFVLLLVLGVFGGVGFVLHRHYQRHGMETFSGNAQNFVIPEADRFNSDGENSKKMPSATTLERAGWEII